MDYDISKEYNHLVILSVFKDTNISAEIVKKFANIVKLIFKRKIKFLKIHEVKEISLGNEVKSYKNHPLIIVTLSGEANFPFVQTLSPKNQNVLSEIIIELYINKNIYIANVVNPNTGEIRQNRITIA